MAGSLKISSVLSTNSIPRVPSSEKSELWEIKKMGFKRSPHSILQSLGINFGRNSSTRLCAGLTQVEPDLNEDPKDRWATNGIESEDFLYGTYDDHHTYFEGDEPKGSFWELVSQDYAAVGPPTGFQGLISWLFPPAIAAGMYFNLPGEYLYMGAALFVVVFCIIEMDKPSEAHNFEPQIYNMERGARDKLISDYNTMDRWEFNEKYGEVWDFTIKRDDITKI